MKKIAVIICSILMVITSLGPIFAQEDFPITSIYAVLINLKDDQVLYEKNSEMQMYPASMTKVMTVLTAMDEIENLQDKIIISSEMLSGLSEEGASIAGFSVQEEVTIEDLIYGALLPSGADACRALAFYVSGSESAFVERMNQKANELQLQHTNFVNTTGLHDDQHYTTAKEMAEIIKIAIKNEVIYKVFTSDTYTTSATPFHPEGLTLRSTLRSQEKSMFIMDKVIQGGKTGFTLEGGLCLASIGSYENADYVLVTGNAGNDTSYPGHIIDAHTIYKHMYETYDYQEVLPPDNEIATIHVKYNFFSRNLKVIYSEALSALLNRSYHKENVQVMFDGPSELEAPIEEGQFLGNVNIMYEDEILKQIPFYAESAIERNWILYGVSSMINFLVSIRYFLLSVLIIFLLWVGYRRYKVLQRRKRRKQRRRK